MWSLMVETCEAQQWGHLIRWTDHQHVIYFQGITDDRYSLFFTEMQQWSTAHQKAMCILV